MEITNKHNLPPAVFNALVTHKYPHLHTGLSATTLIDSPRVRLLREKHWGDLTEDLTDKLWAAAGSALHTMLEAGAGPENLSEERLYHTIKGHLISGAIDLQYLTDEGRILYDYKFTSVWSVILGEKVEWVNQLNVLDYLLWKAKGESALSLNVIVFLRDWSRNRVGESDYPEAPIMVVPITQWSRHKQARYINERLRHHLDADELWGGSLPECSPQERWDRPTMYAITKKGNKRASRVFKARRDAERWLANRLKPDESEIIERSGARTRCEGNYCRVAEHCVQFQSWKATQIPEVTDNMEGKDE